MSLRSCIYKGCDNYIIRNERFGNFFSFFQFPKDTERRKIWMENGKVPPETSENYLLMCSEHFDRKYLAISSRRTTLVGAAVPFPYKEKDSDELITSTIDYIDERACVDFFEYNNETETQNYEDDHLYRNDRYNSNDFLIHTLDNEYDNGTELQDYNENGIKQDYFNLEPVEIIDSTYLRQDEKNELVESTQPAKSLLSNSAVKDETTLRKRKFDNVKIIDDNHVTNLMVNQEEYVQMPKEYYLKEKGDLLAKIKALETKLRAVKQSIDVIQTFIEN